MKQMIWKSFFCFFWERGGGGERMCLFKAKDKILTFSFGLMVLFKTGFKCYTTHLLILISHVIPGKQDLLGSELLLAYNSFSISWSASW